MIELIEGRWLITFNCVTRLSLGAVIRPYELCSHEIWRSCTSFK